MASGGPGLQPLTWRQDFVTLWDCVTRLWQYWLSDQVVTVLTVWQGCDSIDCLTRLRQYLLFDNILRVLTVQQSCDSIDCLTRLSESWFSDKVMTVMNVWQGCDSLNCLTILGESSLSDKVVKVLTVWKGCGSLDWSPMTMIPVDATGLSNHPYLVCSTTLAKSSVNWSLGRELQWASPASILVCLSAAVL